MGNKDQKIFKIKILKFLIEEDNIGKILKYVFICCFTIHELGIKLQSYRI